METDAKDAKRKGARRDAKGNPRITYFPRPDATPESELVALAAVYAFVVQAHERNIVAAPANESRKEVDPEERRLGQDQ
jgi:hypothetical protein